MRERLPTTRRVLQGNEHIRVHRRHRHSNDILSIIGGIFGILLFIGLLLLIGKFIVPIALGLALIGITLVLFYYAGLYGIPLSIVQSIVGHMTPEMTKHYSAHASLSAKREQMRQLPEFMMLTGLETRDFEAAEREELQALISTLPIEKVRELLKMLR